MPPSFALIITTLALSIGSASAVYLQFTRRPNRHVRTACAATFAIAALALSAAALAH